VNYVGNLKQDYTMMHGQKNIKLYILLYNKGIVNYVGNLKQDYTMMHGQKNINKDRRCTYNVILRHFRATIVSVGKQ